MWPTARRFRSALPATVDGVNRRTENIVKTLLAVELAAVVVFSVRYDSLDFRIYMLGGQALTDDASLYLRKWSGLWFTNTPFAALLFAPWSELPLTAARVLWQLSTVAAFASACATALKLAGHRPTRGVLLAVVAAGLLLAPVYHTLFQGQVNVFLLALVLADVHRVSQGRTAGIGIGIAAAVKLTPAIFIPMLLLTRRTTSAMVAGAAFLGCTALAHAVAPDASRQYWLHTFYDASRVGRTYISNQSPYGAACRIMGSPERVGEWFAVVPVVLAVAGLALAAAWARRGDWPAAATVTGVTGLLVSPISWAHHWVWVMPALLLLLRDGHRRAAGCAYVLFVLAPLWWTPHNGHPLQYGFRGPLTLVANCYLVAGLAFLAHQALRLRSTRNLSLTSFGPAWHLVGDKFKRGVDHEPAAEPGPQPVAPDRARARRSLLRP